LSTSENQACHAFIIHQFTNRPVRAKLMNDGVARPKTTN